MNRYIINYIWNKGTQGIFELQHITGQEKLPRD